MSGWDHGGRFGLTATKAEYWHRSCDGACGLRAGWTLPELFVAHLQPLGYTRHYHRSAALLLVSHPQIPVGIPGAIEYSRGPIFEAVSHFSTPLN